MENKHKVSSPLSRRDLLKLWPVVTLAACDMAPGEKTEPFLRSIQKFNDWVQEKVFDPSKPVPEYPDAALTPEEGFRVNGNDGGELEIDADNWMVSVDGDVANPGEYTIKTIKALPKRIMNTRHCCVEGWSMIPKWGGTPLRDFLWFAGANQSARYIAVECADEYYTSYDMASALHAQTLLCYEAYGKPLSIPHGAPLRIVMPTKLGYKSAKWIRKITVTNEKPGGYWEDQGYDWFAGL